MDFLMETRDLTKAWWKKTAVERVNLHVREGEIYGFVGPNGAGKSTVMKMMMNLIHPDAGEARIFGERMGDESYESFKWIGSIIEAPCFYEKMTGRENLELYCEYMGYHNRERIEEALSRMGHLLRLELKKFDLKKNILITLLLILFSILFLTVSLVDSMTDPEQTRDTFESTFLVIGILMSALFLIDSSILTVSLIIREYTYRTIIILFCCPLNKRKLIAAKLILITAFTTASMLAGYLCCCAYIVGVDRAFDMLEGSFHAADLSVWIPAAAVSIASCAVLSLWPFCVGILKKSGSAAIVTSLVALFIRQLVITKAPGNHESLPQLLLLTALTAAAVVIVFRWTVTKAE